MMMIRRRRRMVVVVRDRPLSPITSPLPLVPSFYNAGAGGETSFTRERRDSSRTN